MNVELFQKAGLTEGETKVYLALLELGLTTSGHIVTRASIAKSMVYPILEKLIRKGLVSYIVKEKTKYFQAADPDKLLEYVDEKEDELDDVRKKIEDVLPSLLLKQKMSNKSEATMYLGIKGLRTCHEHFYKKLKKGEYYYYFGVPEYQPDEQHIYWKKDHIRRVKAGIRCQLLFNKGTNREILKNRNSFKGAEARYMPSDVKTPAAFMIYKDTTSIILQHPTPIAVEIINQEIADSFLEYFQEFWKRSKKFI